MPDVTKRTPRNEVTQEFIRTPEQIASDQRAADMRSMGYTYVQIGESLGVTKQTAHRAVQRAINDIPKEGATQVLQMELAKLDRLERFYHTVLGKTHHKIGNTGKIVLREDGTLDDGPRMDAANGLLKVQAQRARLLGLNAPTVSHVTYDIDRDSRIMLEAQVTALKAIGLDDRVDEFSAAFVAALGGGANQVIDVESIES